MSSPTVSTEDIQIRPVHSAADLPAMARLCDIALKPDPIHEVFCRYKAPGKTFYGTTMHDLNSAFNDADQHLFKAVKMDVTGTEEIIGFSSWFVGYITIPKVDQFAKKERPSKSTETDDLLGMSTELEAAKQSEKLQEPGALDEFEAGRKVFENSKVKMANAMIECIRGKKFVRKLLMVQLLLLCKKASNST